MVPLAHIVERSWHGWILEHRDIVAHLCFTLFQACFPFASFIASRLFSSCGKWSRQPPGSESVSIPVVITKVRGQGSVDLIGVDVHSHNWFKGAFQGIGEAWNHMLWYPHGRWAVSQGKTWLLSSEKRETPKHPRGFPLFVLNRRRLPCCLISASWWLCPKNNHCGPKSGH